MLLDIDSGRNPDILCDGRNLVTLPEAQFDAVYCSHNLEHYYRHDTHKVLEGFRHVLKDDGFAHILVPDLGELMRTVVARKLDIDDFLYRSPAGPITVRDVIYGYGIEIERSGNDFFAHKTGFTEKSLYLLLVKSGFAPVFIGTGNFEIRAIAFKRKPTAYIAHLFQLPVSGD